MNRISMTIVATVATALSGTAGASCIVVDGSTADRGACRSIYGEAWGDDGVGDHQTLDYFNSIYRWSDTDVSWETWSYEAVALRNFDGASLSAFTSVELLDHSEQPTNVSTRFGTATYRGRSTGVYALATPLGGNVGALAGNVELTADFTGDELTGKFNGFSILLEAATGDGWQRIPVSVTVAGTLLNDGVIGSGQLDSDFILPGNSTTWRVKRNQVLGLTPELPDLPEFSVKAHFVKDATETIGTLETISPLVVEQGDSTGILSLSMSFGGDTATILAPEVTPASNLSELIADSSNTFSTLTLTLHLDSTDNRASATDQFLIESVTGDGDGGFYVTYVFDGVKEDVHFTSADFLSQSRQYRKEIDDRSYLVWSEASRFDGVSSGKSTEFEYFNTINGHNWGGYRSLAAYGITTGSAGMPTGTAIYTGRMDADIFDNTLDNISPSVARSFVLGKMILTADFADASLSGRVFHLQIRRPGDSQSDDMSSTTRIDITDGAIAADGFTATLTGLDSDADASLTQSMRGFAGDVRGQFYGANARELAAVFNATRAIGDDDDWTMAGWIGGRRTDVVGKHADNEPLSAGVNRLDYSSTSPRIVAQEANNRITSIEADNAGGYTISYTVDGTVQTMSLSVDDLGGTFPSLPEAYSKRTGTNGVFFRRPSSANRVPQGLHYNVKDWSAGVFSDGTTTSLNSATWASVVHGTRTASASMPQTGMATFAGRASAYVFEPSPGEGRASSSYAGGYSGSLTLSADFAAGSVSGRISDLEHSPSYYDNGQYSATAGEFTISNGAIQGNALSGGLSGLGFTGTVSGAFYGPAADEAAGVMQATGAEGKVLHGWFGGARQ